uniref:Acetylglucosamine phosphomutase n=1 Tax=Rhabditophanes sp. KR3021 TaxID=114890 RepID=A0AC35TX63_9BILA
MDPLPNAEYGNSGFVGRGDAMLQLVEKFALKMAICSLKYNKSYGLILTSSHLNPRDTSFQLVLSNGELPNGSVHMAKIQAWKELSLDCFKSRFIEVKRMYIGTRKLKDNFIGKFFISVDDRPESQEILNYVVELFNLVGYKPKYYSILRSTPTPQVSFIIDIWMNDYDRQKYLLNKQLYYSIKTNWILKAFDAISLRNVGRYENTVHLEYSNSSTFPKYSFCENISSVIKLICPNVFEGGQLSGECGPYFVLINRKLPAIFQGHKYKKMVSCDADGDKLLYYFLNGNSLNLISGDKMAVFFATLIHDILKDCEMLEGIRLCVIQSPFANGASTEFLAKKGIDTVFVKGGNSQMRAEAQKYDVGIYFETSGHGSIYFSIRFRTNIQTEMRDKHVFIMAEDDSRSDLVWHDKYLPDCERRLIHPQVLILHYISKLINPQTGDGTANMLTFEFCLRYLGFSIRDVYDMYQELPSVVLTKEVFTAKNYKVTDDGRRLSEYTDLQEVIDSLVKVNGGRATIIPSSMTNTLRIYAENQTLAGATEVARSIRHELDTQFV